MNYCNHSPKSFVCDFIKIFEKCLGSNVIYFLDERNGIDLEHFGLHSISSSAFSCVVNIA